MKSDQGAASRSYERFAVLDYAMIQFPNGAEPFRSMVVDIGLGGLQLRSQEPLPVGEICELQIGTDSGKPLTLKGEVRYSRSVPEKGLFSSGFKFLPENHEERRAIAEYVHSVFSRQGEVCAEPGRKLA